jgi:sulfane dehydrogenase subunit SoxC
MRDVPVLRRRAVLAAAAVVTGGLPAKGESVSATPPWMLEQGAPAGSTPYGVPSPYEKNVVRRMRAPVRFPSAASTGTPLQDLHGIITLNGLHYERHHAGIPEINPDAHRLLIHGLVDRPLILTMDDILRFPSVSHTYFLECAGNTPEYRDAKPTWTPQETHGLLSCCE